ncbi:hypothetical protein LCGC14_1776010, partial [marine sediment metagenome]
IDKLMTFLDANGAVIWKEKELPKYQSSRLDGSSIAQFEMKALDKAQQDMLKWHKDSIKRLI